MLKEYIIKKALDYSFDAARDLSRKLLNSTSANLLTSRSDIEYSLNIHLHAIETWSDLVSFNDLKVAKRTSDIFIELDLYVYPRRIWIERETAETIPLKSIFKDSTRHIVLLGHPGAGKTTSMKYLCRLLLHDDAFQSERFSLPIVLRLRDFNEARSRFRPTLIRDELSQILGLRAKLPQKLMLPRHDDERREVLAKLLITFLDQLKVLLVIDGFDEVATTDQRTSIINEVNYLATNLSQSTIILTSRTGDFAYNIENSDHYELSPLRNDQIFTFAKKWLGDEDSAQRFQEKIKESPFADTALRPLTLAHLCAIYERIKDIPEKPKTVYKKIINLLLEEWDQQRNIKRMSKYAHFEVDRKYEFLCHLAYVLTKTLRRTVFKTEHLLQVYGDIYEEYGLGQNEAKQVVSELETHSGLFLQSGYEEFEFAHKSLQEFLTAEYLVKLPTIPDNWKVLRALPNELAIAVAISSSPSRYFVELVLGRFMNQALPESFVRSFLSRLLVEKPDFKTTIWMDLSFLVLYSLHLEQNVIGANQLELFRLDSVFKEFERVMSRLRSTAMQVILQDYRSEAEYRLDDKELIYLLVRNPNAKISAQIAANLPDRLYVRQSLLANVSPN